MAGSSALLLEQFIRRPPRLQGGVRLRVEPENGRRAWLHLDQQGHSAALHATALTLPYPSGLRRLLSADPGLDAVLVERIPRGLDAAARDANISYLDLN